MTKRTYKSLIEVFKITEKEKLTARDFWMNTTTMTRNSVYQTISRAIRDGVLIRNEEGFYYIVDNEKDEV